jgi:sugar phosphate permease
MPSGATSAAASHPPLRAVPVPTVPTTPFRGGVLRNPNIWLLGVINACSSFYSYMLLLWFPTYLKEGRGLDEITSGSLGSLPYLFGAVGVLLGGYLGDWLTARTGSRRLALAGMGAVGLTLAGALVPSSVQADTPLLAVLLCSTGYFFSYLQLAAWWGPWVTWVAATWGRCSGCAT